MMDAELQGSAGYFRWEIANHLSAYGVSADMYTFYIQALGDVLLSALGEAWRGGFEEGWPLRVADLMRDVADSRP